MNTTDISNIFKSCLNEETQDELYKEFTKSL